MRTRPLTSRHCNFICISNDPFFVGKFGDPEPCQWYSGVCKGSCETPALLPSSYRWGILRSGCRANHRTPSCKTAHSIPEAHQPPAFGEPWNQTLWWQVHKPLQSGSSSGLREHHWASSSQLAKLQNHQQCALRKGSSAAHRQVLVSKTNQNKWIKMVWAFWQGLVIKAVKFRSS